MDLIEIKEGKTRLLIPDVERLTSRNVVFFNPQMELNRDISVAIAGILKPRNFCDALAGSGARGVRIANEAGVEVRINDINPKAFELIRRNGELNGVDIEASNLDANLLLLGERFDFIDIDPFGTPVRFIDSALRSIENGGILAVTATDTSALCGTYPRACRRKYDAIPLRTDYYNELGVRILIGYLARSALRYDVGINPIFSHCTRHYFRVYLRIKRSGGHANKILDNITYIKHCFTCLNREFSGLEGVGSTCDCGADLRSSGPLWNAAFADPSFCKKLGKRLMDENFKTMHESIKLVESVGNEQMVEIPYYNVHKIFGKMGMAAIPMDEIMGRLNGAGFKATRTHFSALGIRTDADVSDIYGALY
jgi:tRNA (guanine26-N2/guanine27-N2)-dimethyltransferase